MSRGYLNSETNLRDGPGTGYDSRGLVRKNRPVKILDSRSENEWVKVRVVEGDYAGLVGWMYRDNVDMDR